MKKKRYKVISALLLIIICYLLITKLQTLHDINYTNSKLGISLNFPKTWGGKYKVEERNDSIYVYYTPSLSIARGLLFAIVKQNSNGEPCDGDTYDSIGSTEIQDIKGEKYKFGGTTDIGFPDNSIHFKDYLKMRGESSNILKEMKIL